MLRYLPCYLYACILTIGEERGFIGFWHMLILLLLNFLLKTPRGLKLMNSSSLINMKFRSVSPFALKYLLCVSELGFFFLSYPESLLLLFSFSKELYGCLISLLVKENKMHHFLLRGVNVWQAEFECQTWVQQPVNKDCVV